MKYDPSNLFTAKYWSDFFSARHSFAEWIAKCGRVAVNSARGFVDDDCASRASALTFYSLLSIVPVLAVAFGIAKGFGFEQSLEKEISEKFLEQREVVEYLINFAYKTLENTKSGLIAGVGLIVLFWSVIKLFSNMETSFNAIWKVKKRRSWARSFSDYLAMMLFCPIFFAASSSLSVFVVTQLLDLSKDTGFWDTVNTVLVVAFHIFPLFLAWLMFTALYAIMPNTKVPLKYAFIAGICAGTAYQITQALYIKFQIGLSSYGAIYGSFAALPLFLLWLNISWLIALAGAEIAYHAENDNVLSIVTNAPTQHEADTRILGLLLMQECTRAFYRGEPPPSAGSLSYATGAPVSVVRNITQLLMDAGLLAEVNWQGNSGEFYQPGRDIRSITLKSVCDALDTARHDSYLVVHNEDVEYYRKALEAVDKTVEGSAANLPIDSLVIASKREGSLSHG